MLTLVNSELIRCGVTARGSRLSKIIFDQSTGNVDVKNSTISRISTHKFSCIPGSRRGWAILNELRWRDAQFIEYGLAKIPKDDRD